MDTRLRKLWTGRIAAVGLVLLNVASVSIGAASSIAAETRDPGGGTSAARSIELRIVVPLEPEEVFRLWTDAEATTKFFGKSAVIEAHVGGLYEIGFESPDGLPAGPRGTRILALDAPRALSFEWTMPRSVEHLNTKPLPTAVDLRFEAFGEGATDLRLVHRGFGDGDDWDFAYAFFQRNWFEVLYRLRRFADTP